MKTYLILSSLIMCTYGALHPSKSDDKTTTAIQNIEYTTDLSEMEKEKEKIEKELEFIPKPVREQALIYKLAAERAEKEEKKLYNETVQWLACVKQFRYRMDIFGADFGHKGGSRLKTSSSLIDAFKSIKRVMKNRSSIIHDSADKLATLYKDYDNNMFSFDPKFPEYLAWKGQFKFAYKTLKKINITIKEPNQLPSKPNISALIMEIYSASNETTAIEVFQKQCESCYWAKIKNDPDLEYPELKKLATLLPEEEERDLIHNYKANLQTEDVVFLRDLLRCGTFFVKDNKRYTSCVEVFYFSPSSSIELMNRDLEKTWPELDFPLRVDRYCSAFADLYDLVSFTDVHPLPNTHIMKCDGDSLFFYNYIKAIVGSEYRLNDYILVGRVLGKISFNFTIPATP